MQEMQVKSLGQEDTLEKERATHSSILAWGSPMDRVAWQGYSPCGHKRVGHDSVTKKQQFHSSHCFLFVYFVKCGCFV